jgi:peptide/nickel transport system permease protein
MMLRRFFAWLRRDMRAAISLAFLLALGLLALCAPLIAPYPVTAQDVDNTLASPSAAHLLGTDDLGRDVFSRMVHGGAGHAVRQSGLAVGIALLLGLPVGLLAGYSGGWVDDGISRFIDALLSFPSIVLAIAVTGALGIGLTNGMIAVGIVFSPADRPVGARPGAWWCGRSCTWTRRAASAPAPGASCGAMCCPTPCSR